MNHRFFSVLFAAMLAVSCGVNKAPTKQYTMHGKILSIDEQSHLAKIDGGQIGDWMGPMAMDYSIPNRADWEKLKVGQTIDAKVFVRGDEVWVADIHPSPAPATPHTATPHTEPRP